MLAAITLLRRLAGALLITNIIVGFADGSANNEFGGIYFPGNPPLDTICSESERDSILVITGENRYGIVSHKLAEIKWKAVAVNGNQVFVNTLHNKTYTTNFNGLSDKQRELIQKIRSEHLMNLNGLGLTRNVQSFSSSAASSYYGLNNASSKASSYGNSYSNSQAATDHISTSAGPKSYGTSGHGAYYRANVSNPPPVAYNYYNLGLKSCFLSEHISGDVYSFSLQNNILDIFSSTVMVHQKSSESILYRDHKYFSYARQFMPSEINRFFVTHDSVIFVYNDATVLVKSSLMLNPVELELVLSVRETVKDLVKGLVAAADIAGHSRVNGNDNNNEKPAHGTSLEEIEAAEEDMN